MEAVRSGREEGDSELSGGGEDGEVGTVHTAIHL